MRHQSARFQCLALESRDLPSTLTLIATGAATVPDWALDLAAAIAARAGHPLTDAQLTGSVATYDAGTDGFMPPVESTGFVLLNWDGSATAEVADKAGAKFADYLRTLLPATGTVDLHFVGEGTGAFVNLAAIRRLAADDAKVGRLQMTTLDAAAPAGAFQPLPLPLPTEPPVPDPSYPIVVGEPLPPTEPPPGPNDPPVYTGGLLQVPYNVDWADNYFETTGRTPGYYGSDTSVPGLQFAVTDVGFELDLTSALAAWTGRPGNIRDEVHDWYHWTVDTGLANAPAYLDPALVAERAGFANGTPDQSRAAAYGMSIDLDHNGQPDDLGNGANVGYGLSIDTLFAARPPQNWTGLDLALVIDTTGSMTDDIDAVKARALEILNTVRNTTPDARIGIVLYRDFPDGTHGSPNDYQSTVALPFTADIAAAEAAIRAIQVDGGADWAESVYSGLTTGIDASGGLGGWRGGSVRRSIILMGDAPPHLTEPGTGFTKASTLVRAARQGVDIATVATTAGTSAWWMFQSIADLTGGQFFYTGSAPPPGGDWVGDDGGWGYGGPIGILPYPVEPDGSIGGPMVPLSPPPGGVYATTAAAAAADSILLAVRGIAAGFRSGPLPPIPTGLTNAIAVVGTGPGGLAVTLVNPSGAPVVDFTAVVRAAFTGTPQVTTADFNRDNVPDLVVGSGAGGLTLVKVFDSSTKAELFTLNPFEAGFIGGVNVAVGDVTGDRVPDLVVTADQGGGARVRVFDGVTFAQIADFFGIEDDAFRGGGRVAVGDINGDGVGDLIVSAGYGGGPRVAAFDGASLATGPKKLFADFLAFEAGLSNGTYVTAGDVNGDGKAEIIAGGGPGGAPRVTVFDGADLLANKQTRTTDFFAGDAANRDGVRVSVKNLDGDARADLLTGSGTGGPVTAYAGKAMTGAPPTLFALDDLKGYTGGVYVG